MSKNKILKEVETLLKVLESEHINPQDVCSLELCWNGADKTELYLGRVGIVGHEPLRYHINRGSVWLDSDKFHSSVVKIKED